MASFESSMVRYLIGRARIKYTVLDQLFRSVYIPQPGIVMCVDASSILYRLYRKHDLDMIYSVDPNIVIKDLVISFLNTLAHYRRYMMTRLNKTNDIIVYFNRIPPDYQTMIYPDYRKSWYKLFDPNHPDFGPLTAIVEEAFNFIQGLVPYFEGIYVIDNIGVDDFTTMYHMINSPKYKDWYHLIFSRNMLTTQMVDSSCSVLYNKRDDSYMITNGTVFKNGILKGRKTGASENLTPKMLPFIWTLGGCSDVDLKKSKYAGGVADTVKILNPLADQRLFQDTMSIQSFLKELAKNTKDNQAELKSVPDQLVNRYRILNLQFTAAALTDSQKINIWKSCIDLYDQFGLEEINDRLAMIGSSEELLEITNLNMSTVEDDPMGTEGYFNINISM